MVRVLACPCYSKIGVEGLLDLLFCVEGLFRRDYYVFNSCKRRGIPCVGVIGGGYSRNLDALSLRHTIVHRAATKVQFARLLEIGLFRYTCTPTCCVGGYYTASKKLRIFNILNFLCSVYPHAVLCVSWLDAHNPVLCVQISTCCMGSSFYQVVPIQNAY